MVGNFQQGISDPATQGNIALTQIIYPAGHPNYATSIEKTIENIKQAKQADLKAFHKKYFGPTAMHLVAVGDVDTEILYRSLEKNFNNWSGGVNRTVENHKGEKGAAITKIVTIPEKPSAELFIGQYTGIKRSDPEFLPFYLANSILRGGFSGRLMKTVRDEAGLTYGIYTKLDGYTFADGYWYINASFNPQLLSKGKAATMDELSKWANQGITAEELKDKKTSLIGSFKIGLATTRGMAANILAVLQRGEQPEYIYKYPEELNAVTLKQVNAAIKNILTWTN